MREAEMIAARESIRAEMVAHIAAHQIACPVTLVDCWPNIRRLSLPVTLGSHSWYVSREDRRILYTNGLIEVAPGLFETPGAVARLYLDVAHNAKHARAYRRTSEQWAIHSEWPALPSYANPQVFDKGYYVDIRGAFMQAMLVAGWRVDYRPGVERPRYIMQDRPIYDWPFPSAKTARSAIVSMGRPSRMRIWACPECEGEQGPEECNEGGTPHPRSGQRIRRKRSPYFNPDLWRLISDVLNSVALEAIQRADVAYVNTDGFICQDEGTLDILQNILEEWGLEYRVKISGAGWVAARGNYRVGDVRTKGEIPQRRLETSDYVNRVPWWDWLKRRYSEMAAQRRRELGAQWRVLLP